MKITIEGNKVIIEDATSVDLEEDIVDDGWENVPDITGLVDALQSMKEAYLVTWEDRNKINSGRGAYKIRQLFREAEKAGLL